MPSLLTLLLLALAPSAAHAHGALRDASPAASDTLREVPREIRLAFNQRVEVDLAEVSLWGPEGVVALGPLAAVPGSDRGAVVAPIAGALGAGSYTVRWQIVSADGHPVRGEYSFTVAEDAAGLAPAAAAAAPAAQTAPPPPPAEPTLGVLSAPYVAVRWLTLLAILGLVGAVSFRWLVLRAAAGWAQEAEAPIEHAAARAAAGLGAASAALLLLAAMLRLLAQRAAVGADSIAPLLTGTLWGWGWSIQVGAALVALAGYALARAGRGAGWWIALLGALVAAATPSLSGHAAAAQGASRLAISADAAHVLGAGGWLGTLLVLLLAGLPAARRLDPARRGAAVAALVNAFSPTALSFATLVVITGLFASWLHLGTLAALWESDYGRTLLAKLALLLVVFATGAYNWRRVRPALHSDAALPRFRRSATVELATGALVLLVTALLIATPPP